MNETKEALIKYRLTRAKKTLDDALMLAKKSKLER